MYIKWALAPSGYYICVAEFNNKHYYASGRTVDILEKNIKRTLYMQERVSATQVHLEQTKSEQIDLQYASKMFMAKFVRVKPGARPTVVNKTLIAPPKPQYEYITEQDGNEMIVYELREVARYKLHVDKTPAVAPTVTPEPLIPFRDRVSNSIIQQRYADTDPESPVLQPDSESQVEYL